MAMLHKIRFLENERVDKPDHDNIQEFVADDFKAYNRHFFANEDKWIGKGFEVSVVSGLNISVAVDGSTLFNTEDTNGNEFYLGESGHADLEATLTDSSTNYIHLQIVQGETGTSATRVFWDPTLNSGEGGEFLQTIDTEEYIDVQLYITTSGFSSDADLIPLATMVASGGSVSSTIDNRNLFFRLGKGQTLNAEYDFALSSPSEPASSSFTGGDKQIGSLKDWLDLAMTRIKNVSGEDYWFVNTGGFNVMDLYTDLGNTIMTGGGTISYSASNVFSFSSDIILKVVSLGVTYTIPQSSESGQTVGDGQVAYINIDAVLGGASSGERDTDGDRELIIADWDAVPFDQDIYWVAYRTGSKLFVRGMRQELEQGEETQLGDGITDDLLTFIGSTGETDNAPNYSSNVHVTDGTSLVAAISALDAAIPGSDHGALSGLADDDHPQYAEIANSETISGSWSFTSIPSCSVAPTTGNHLTNKTYVDGLLVTDHGALSGLGDDDHPQYAQIAATETISAAWSFTSIPSCSVAPTIGNHLANKTYVDSVAGVSDHGALSGLSDDDHPQYAQIAATETISAVWTHSAQLNINSDVITAFNGSTGTVFWRWNSSDTEFEASVLGNTRLLLTDDDDYPALVEGSDTTGNVHFLTENIETPILGTGVSFSAVFRHSSGLRLDSGGCFVDAVETWSASTLTHNSAVGLYFIEGGTTADVLVYYADDGYGESYYPLRLPTNDPPGDNGEANADSVAKVYCRSNPSGVIQDSYNIDSVGAPSGNLYTFTFDRDFVDALYVCLSEEESGGSYIDSITFCSSSRAVGSVAGYVINTDIDSQVTANWLGIAMFGELTT